MLWRNQGFSWLLAGNPPPPANIYFLNQGVDTILALTLTSHLNVRVLEPPPP